MKKISSLICFLFLFTSLLPGIEKDVGFAIIDKEPWKQSWVQENDGTWKLTLMFDKAVIFTYFKNKPLSGTFLGLSESNKPLRQEIIFSGVNSPIEFVESQFEKFGDGAICWALKTGKKIYRNGAEFSDVTTAIIDDPVSHNDEYRYSLWK